MPMRPSAMRRAMVRSERTMRGFFQHRVRQRVESLQEPCALLVGERPERRPEWAVTLVEPGVHTLARLRSERHHRPAPVRGILAPDDEPALLEIAGKRALLGHAEPG